MAFTHEELDQLKSVVDESIATHPRFDQLKAEITADTTAQITAAIEDLSTVTIEGLNMISERFDQVDHRFDHVDARFEQVDRRFDSLRITSH